MKLSVLKEKHKNETRVAATPETTKLLINLGFDLTGAGVGFGRRFQLSAFGQLTSNNADPEVNELLFGARPFVTEDGLGEFRRRFYDPRTGRFIQDDPLELGVYVYAKNSPLLYVDPSGEMPALEYAEIACKISIPAALSAKGYADYAAGLLLVTAEILADVRKRDVKASYLFPFPPIPGYPPPLFVPLGDLYKAHSCAGLAADQLVYKPRYPKPPGIPVPTGR